MLTNQEVEKLFVYQTLGEIEDTPRANKNIRLRLPGIYIALNGVLDK